MGVRLRLAHRRFQQRSSSFPLYRHSVFQRHDRRLVVALQRYIHTMISRGIELADQPIHCNICIRDSLLFNFERPNALLYVVIGHQNRDQVVLLFLLQPKSKINTDCDTELILQRISSPVMQSSRFPGPAILAPIAILRMSQVVLFHHLFRGSEGSSTDPGLSSLFFFCIRHIDCLSIRHILGMLQIFDIAINC